MKSKRIQWLDFAKGIAIFFVLLAHWGSPFLNKYGGTFNNIIKGLLYVSFTFVMPLFFSISGYLYKRVVTIKDYLILVYKKSISLLIPYLFFSFLFAFKSLLHHDIKDPIDIFLGYKFSSYLWFLLALFFIFIIVGLLDLLHINVKIQLLLSIILIILEPDFWLLQNNTNIYLNLFYCTVTYLLFFYVGIGLRNLFQTQIIKKINILCTNKMLIGIYIIWLLLLLIQFDFTCSTYQTDFLTLSDMLSKTSIVLILFITFTRLKHDMVFKYFSYYGKFTLVIYLAHMIIIMLLEHFMNISSTFSIYLFIIGIPIIWIFSVFICKLSMKYAIINFIFYPRKYINKHFINSKLFNGSK